MPPVSYSGQIELTPGNGIDDDCDGLIDIIPLKNVHEPVAYQATVIKPQLTPWDATP